MYRYCIDKLYKRNNITVCLQKRSNIWQIITPPSLTCPCPAKPPWLYVCAFCPLGLSCGWWWINRRSLYWHNIISAEIRYITLTPNYCHGGGHRARSGIRTLISAIPYWQPNNKTIHVSCGNEPYPCQPVNVTQGLGSAQQNRDPGTSIRDMWWNKSGCLESVMVRALVVE